MTDETKQALTGEDDAPSIFDDLDKLKADSVLPDEEEKPVKKRRPARREKIAEEFAPVPYDRARKLFRHIGGPTWLLLIEIDRLNFDGGGRNPVQMTTDALKGSGLTRSQKWRGLRALEQAGIITVDRADGRCPLITFHWYPLKP